VVFLEVGEAAGAAHDPAEDHLRALLNCEGAASARLPDVLLVVVVDGRDANVTRDRVDGEKNDAEPPDDGKGGGLDLRAR